MKMREGRRSGAQRIERRERGPGPGRDHDEDTDPLIAVTRTAMRIVPGNRVVSRGRKRPRDRHQHDHGGAIRSTGDPSLRKPVAAPTISPNAMTSRQRGAGRSRAARNRKRSPRSLRRRTAHRLVWLNMPPEIRRRISRVRPAGDYARQRARDKSRRRAGALSPPARPIIADHPGDQKRRRTEAATRRRPRECRIFCHTDRD